MATNFLAIIKKFLSFFVAIFFVFNLLGQSDNSGIPYVRNYYQQETSNITQTWALLQAKSGIIISGNGYGISEFDGRTWRWMRINNNSSIYSLFEDKDSTLFLGAINEFGFLEVSENGFLRYKSLFNKIPATYQKFDVIWQILRYKDYVFFMSDYSLFVYDGTTIKVIRAATKFQKMLVSANRLYIYENTVGLRAFDLNTFSFVNVKAQAPAMMLTSMESWGNDILFCDQQGYLSLYKNENFETFNAPVTNSIVKARPYCLLRINDSTYAVGTILDGVIIFNKKGELIYHINRERGLDNNKIHCLTQDKSGNIWVGHENGVSYIELNSPMRFLPHQTISGSGYAVKGHKGKLYFGTTEGLFMSDFKTNTDGIALKNVQNFKGTEGQVWDITSINNDLLVNNFKGITVVNGNKAEPISTDAGSWKVSPIPNNPDYFLQGTYEGLTLLKKQNNKWQTHKKLEGFVESSRLFEIDKNAIVWVSHGFKGIFKVTMFSDFQAIKDIQFYGKSKGFPSNLGINVFKINNQILFTSEFGGIYTYNTEKDTFTEYTKYEQFIGKHPQISRLYEDEQKNIWFVCKDKMGILKYEKENQYKCEIQPFSGLHTKLISGFELIYPCDNNQVIFGARNGFILYNMNLPKDYNLIYNTFIRNVEIISSKDSSIYGGYKYKNWRKPELSWRNNSVRFSFSSPFFEQNESVLYSYYLEGFDERWSTPGVNTMKEYLRLSGGNYVFHVKSVNIYGTESREDTFAFYVEPHFTRTWWAYTIYVLLGIASFIIFIYFYTHNREKKHRRLALQKEKQIMELKHGKLLDEFEHKNTELSTLTLQVVKKNDVLNEIKQKLETTLDKQGSDIKRDINSVIRTLEHEISEDRDWEAIELYFNNVYKGFLKKLRDKYPELRSTELKLCAYIRMDLSNKEIAALMNNTIRGVEAYRYRLRKSLNLKREESLKEFLFNFE